MSKLITRLTNYLGYYLLPSLILLRGKIRRRGDELLLKCGGRQLRFKYINWAPFPLNEVFVKEVYKKLDVKGKVVVDVGASIGDTATYFSVRGARHIYGFEVDAGRWKISKENLKRNGIKNATLYLSGYKPSLVGQKATVLKVDCEGCEYSLFKNLGQSLKKFDQIIIEYHHGSSVLEKQLTSLGFKIEFLTPQNGELGVLYAKKMGK
ncbi:MAG: hypothetical protein KGH65_04550 [Candidatus Micrarchaeota archaeon]|nr:hypothetical protein [Candidatus Micrarchaeota archaeon]